MIVVCHTSKDDQSYRLDVQSTHLRDIVLNLIELVLVDV